MSSPFKSAVSTALYTNDLMIVISVSKVHLKQTKQGKKYISKKAVWKVYYLDENDRYKLKSFLTSWIAHFYYKLLKQRIKYV